MVDFEPLSPELIEKILHKIDFDQNGIIDYDEFLAHSLTKKQLTVENLSSFFEIMLPLENEEADSDNSSSYEDSNYSGHC